MCLGRGCDALVQFFTGRIWSVGYTKGQEYRLNDIALSNMLGNNPDHWR
jgi:hypothetical protein